MQYPRWSKAANHLLPVLSNVCLPLIGSPLFTFSVPALVTAQCKAEIVGAFPALNAREEDGNPPLFQKWLKQITEALDRYNRDIPETPAAPFAVNQIVHGSNTRLSRDLVVLDA